MMLLVNFLNFVFTAKYSPESLHHLLHYLIVAKEIEIEQGFVSFNLHNNDNNRLQQIQLDNK